MNAPTGLLGVLLDARYRVGPEIARGGMSIVYRGTDTRLDRPVAIKVMTPALASDPVYRSRFEREARSAARIDHPAIVDVYDQGDDPSGALFLVMELVEGGTLRDVLRARGPIGVPAAIAVLEPVLAGLSQAHRLGMVHRDIKPENVLVSRSGEVKVADFGLATAAARAGTSHAGMILGTIAYLSPEQVATGAADARSDVYAAGVLLYELLTGTPPYTGDTPISVALRHVNEDVPPPSLIATEVPPELDALVLAATRRDPAGRPADAAAFLAGLRRVRDRLAVPRVPVPQPPPRPVEQQDTVPATADGGVGLVGTGFTGPGAPVGGGPGVPDPRRAGPVTARSLPGGAQTGAPATGGPWSTGPQPGGRSSTGPQSNPFPPNGRSTGPQPSVPQAGGAQPDSVREPGTRRSDADLQSDGPPTEISTPVTDAGPGGTRTMDRPESVHATRRTTAATSAPAVAPVARADRRQARGRSRRLFVVWIALVLVLGLLVAGAAWWLGNGRWTDMPSVVGMQRTAAERVLAEADLVVAVTEVHHDSVAADVVTAAEPAQNSRLLRGTAVRLTVSTGRPMVPVVVPGTAVAAVEQSIRNADLTPVQATGATEFSGTVPAGMVIRTDPPAGAVLPVGAPVTLVLSRGVEPKKVKVPDVTGDRAKSAAETLADAGLKSEIESGFPFGHRDNGRVVRQDPAGGSEVAPGSTVTLTTF